MTELNPDIINSTATTGSSGNLFDNDPNTGDKITLFVNGELVETSLKIDGEFGSLTVQANGDYTYTPSHTLPNHQFFAVGYNLFDEFNYTVVSDAGTASSSITTYIADKTLALDFENQETVFADGISTTTYFDEFNQVIYQTVWDGNYQSHIEFDLTSTEFANITYVFDSSGTRLTETTLYLDGSTKTLTYDYEGDEDYVTQTAHANADGEIQTIEQMLDDGGTRSITFTGDTVGRVAARANEYDSEGVLRAKFTLLNNETLVKQNLDAEGNVISREISDEADNGPNARNWDDKTISYNAEGDIVGKLIEYDNEDTREFTYVDGVKRTDHSVDTSNAKNWAERTLTYDENGLLDSDQFVFDSGVTRDRDFDDNNTLRQLTYTDVSADKSYQTSTYNYDQNGNLRNNVLIKDNSDGVQTNFDQNGLRTSRTLIDNSETKDYYARTYEYNAAGEVIGIFEIPDDAFLF